MPTISIIIPTFSNATGPHSVRECLKSIVDHTNLFGVEIIVVANGAPESSRSLDRDFPCRLLWFDEPIGYTRAANEGIKAATGDYLLLLNDDTVILGPNWIDILMLPFSDARQWNIGCEHVGLTGPMMEWDPNSNAKFLIFFCVMIRHAVFDEIGLLDEAFSPGFGEDTDFCLRAQAAGWEVLMVPNERHHLAEREDAADHPAHKAHFWVAEFPIFHAGEATFENWAGGEELLRKNRRLLKERWSGKVPDVERAIKVDGWMAPSELRWLATAVMNRGKV